MKSRYILSFLFSSLFVGNVFAYDGDLAAKMEPALAKMDQSALAKAASKMTMDDLLAAYAKKEKMTILDIRTPAETRILMIPGSLQIPLNKLLSNENLDKLPIEGKIVVVCHSGARAGIATTLLRMIGFKHAFTLEGGISALAHEATPKTLPSE